MFRKLPNLLTSLTYAAKLPALAFQSDKDRQIQGKVLRLFCVVCHRIVGMASTLETLKFDNKVLRDLPIDTETENYRRQVSGACFSRVMFIPFLSFSSLCHTSAILF